MEWANSIFAPVHNVHLKCSLLSGDVTVAVRPELPVEGVDLILGNDLVGGHVWPDNPLKNGAGHPPGEISQSSVIGPEGFPTCAVTHAMAKKGSDQLSHKGNTEAKLTVFVPALLPSISTSDLIKEQTADPSLKAFFEQVSPAENFQSASQGCFMLNGILVRKWVPHGDNFLGEPVMQTVVPQKFRQMVLKTVHDIPGHVGIRKTYYFCTISFGCILREMFLLTLRLATFVN